MPVEFPDGTEARNIALLVYRSTSTVGIPLLSRICLAFTFVITDCTPFFIWFDCEIQLQIQIQNTKSKRDDSSKESDREILRWRERGRRFWLWRRHWRRLRVYGKACIYQDILERTFLRSILRCIRLFHALGDESGDEMNEVKACCCYCFFFFFFF